MKLITCRKIEKCCHEWWKRRTTTKDGRGEKDMLGRGKEITGGDGGGDETIEK